VLDFGKLPRVLAEEVGRRLGHDEWTVVRTHMFGSYAANADPRDLEPVERRLNFFTMLRQQHHYEIEAFPIEFRGKRLRRTDRDPSDTFEPREKCVDIALATSMLFNAAMANAYDVAIAVLGDQDFKPVLQSVRRLGKRVAIASIAGACSGEYSDPARPRAGARRGAAVARGPAAAAGAALRPALPRLPVAIAQGRAPRRDDLLPEAGREVLLLALSRGVREAGVRAEGGSGDVRSRAARRPRPTVATATPQPSRTRPRPSTPRSWAW
jgi:hypothetical protein